MERIELKVEDVNVSSCFMMIFSSCECPNKQLPVVIGEFEAVYIHNLLKGIVMPRPMTYELLITLINITGIEVSEIDIYKFSEGIFYSKIVGNHDGIKFEIDARTSDAVAVSLKLKVPIFIDKRLFVNLSADSRVFQTDYDGEDIEDSTPKSINPMEDMSTEEIIELLDDAVEREEYEFAEFLKNIIDSRK